MQLTIRLRQKNIAVQLLKVKSHATVEQMELGLFSPEFKFGNDRADHFAGLGADINELANEQKDLISWTDIKINKIQKRLVHLVQNHLGAKEINRKQSPMPVRSPLNRELLRLGHNFQTNNGWSKCEECGQT